MIKVPQCRVWRGLFRLGNSAGGKTCLEMVADISAVVVRSHPWSAFHCTLRDTWQS